MGDTANGANGANGASHALPALVTSASAFLEHDYDYVIIGGGTAGLNPDISVGVLEAGKNKLDDPLVDTPGLFMQMLGDPEYDWSFKTTPQAISPSILLP
ncbi:hypothetical protein SLS58_005426 [Diplodia intermedia]|uniref:Uncharacterized protein n=1 Tax=Diplodia intermedia TaxID=856260 RepID=A0ABR3TQI1_9PEZI